MTIIEDLQQIAGRDAVLVNEPMAQHTTFRVGGPASYFVSPTTAKAVADLIVYAKAHDLDYTIVGNGSNLLVADAGFEGMVLHIGKELAQITVEGDTITAGAGAPLAAIAKVAREHALAGFEFAAGIPGSLGGAVMMNAGAYGGEMKDVLAEAITVTPDGQVHVYPVEALELGYRHSVLMSREDIVVSATIRLKQGDSEVIQANMEDFAGRRREKQPLEYPSAGSTFKRPEGHFAGALIEAAGLKNCGVGGACVSAKHAGFVINRDNATAQDIYDTIRMVQERVMADAGVMLEPEVRFLGDFKEQG